jgi:uncharacterized RDD family membrane protein YckC
VKTEQGVYFRREDYASFWIRLLVDLIDLLAFSALCLVLTVLVLAIFPFDRSILNLVILIWVAVAFAYFAILKRSRFRTLGYRVGQVRIVGLDGRAPSYLSLTLRLMFGMLGPLNWLDLVWLSNDANRQALRDKFANTYVIKVNAHPAGHGRVVFRYYSILFYNCLFQEVEADLGVSSCVLRPNWQAGDLPHGD